MIKKIDILCFAAHPDDVEISCAGTVIKHVQMGLKVGIIDLTKGELGSRGSAELRMIEAQNSSKVMGLSVRDNLGMKDGFIEYNERNLAKIVREIRKYQPEIVLANSPIDRHPDHGNAAKLVRDAAFYSGLIRYETRYKSAPQEKWRPKAIYHYIQDFNLEPDFVVDVSDVVEKKFEALLSFESQFYSADMKGPKTPISGKEFIDFLRGKMRTYGRPIQVDYAEGFVVDRTPGVDNLFNLI